MFFPNEWKVARVNALHKKGPRNMLDNYRPISILPVVSKVFERILYKQLVEYLDAENLLSEHQFGFRCSHSTASALLDCSNEWYCNMDRGLYIFLDLKKAFDTIYHVLLLGKLEACGIGDDALNLLACYFADRNRVESLRVQFLAHFSFWYTLFVCQIASNIPHPEYLLTIPA